jgi:F0F1-type ATP synthase membrane subunit a
MEMLIWLGMWGVYFLIHTLTTLYFAMIGGIGLAVGFHLFRKWNTKRRDKRNLIEAEEAIREVESTIATVTV